MNNSFYALLSRMKYLNRWGLMKNTRTESLSEHSLEVAFIAHALAVIHNTEFGGSADVGSVVLSALYHDVSEILTGDMPTPIKYYNEEIKKAYRDIEKNSRKRLLEKMPEKFAESYRGYFEVADGEVKKIIKAADKISALIKCNEELAAHNGDFESARKATLASLEKIDLPAAQFFIDEFIPEYCKDLDELCAE